jgi:vancomycin resistance protein VanJ
LATPLRKAAQQKPSTWGRRIKRGSLRLTVFCAYAYPALMLLAWGMFVFVGDDWWVVSAALYLPRLAFALPLPILLLALWLSGKKRLLWTQALAGYVTFVPLMGFVFPWPNSADEGRPTLKVMTFNADSAYAGTERLAQGIFALAPDIVVLQESPWGTSVTDALRARYPHTQGSTQFVIASRFPILESTDPDKLPYEGRQRSPRFMRYLVLTPFGPVALYSVHPVSPRGALGLHGFRGMFRRLRTGEVLLGDPEASVEGATGLRTIQIKTAANMAKNESNQVIFAGDLNLPGLSGPLRTDLGQLTDGFASASWGFGYTYPQKFPFLRLDRVLVSSGLKVTDFQVGCRGLSDHLCVMATLQRQ